MPQFNLLNPGDVVVNVRGGGPPIIINVGEDIAQKSKGMILEVDTYGYFTAFYYDDLTERAEGGKLEWVITELYERRHHESGSIDSTVKE